jgi:hypothetical protein
MFLTEISVRNKNKCDEDNSEHFSSIKTAIQKIYFQKSENKQEFNHQLKTLSWTSQQFTPFVPQ